MFNVRNSWWDTASRDELFHRQSAILRRFLRQRVSPFTAFYRQMFEGLDLDPSEIRDVDDLARLPFTRKRDLDSARDFVVIPDEEVLRRQPSTIAKAILGGPWNIEERLATELRPILLTSTTGRSSDPVPFLYTQHDLDRLTEGGRRLMLLARAQKSWRTVNAFPFAPHLAFWQAHHAGLGFNSFMLSTGGGKTMGTEGNLRIIDKIDPDALVAMPTFLYHLLQEAVEAGCHWIKIRRLVLGGEKVPTGMRRKLVELCAQLGSDGVRVLSTYGFTEAKIAWAECAGKPGDIPHGFHIYPDMGFVEVVNPDTGERVPDETPGEIVYTSLDARGTVVLRYRTGDLIERGLTHAACPGCGRTCPRLLGKISRVSDIRRLAIGKLKGTLVDFNALENLLDDTPGLGAWQLELRKKNDDPLATDEIHVHAVATSRTEAELRDAIVARFRQGCEFTPNSIQFHDQRTIKEMHGVGRELKEQKVVDHRPEEPED